MTVFFSTDPIAERCFPGDTQLPPVLAGLMTAVIGGDAQYQTTIGGRGLDITIGTLTVFPDYGSELQSLERKLGNLLLVTALILLMNLLIYRPVRNALAPAEVILNTLREMENGDLRARVSELHLIEFNRIGQGFNRLADRLQETIRNQRQLAHRLLSAREEERHYLARELHDEFGQYLASINAESAFARELADESVPALRPCAESISKTTQHMMETLHHILHRLRPVGLEEFGLLASLEQLVADWNQRCRGKTLFTLKLEGELEELSDDINVSIYRIVQESITNALRHGRAHTVVIDLRQQGNSLTLEIRNDGGIRPVVEGTGRDSEPRKGGYGLLGMEERVLALGGVFFTRQDAEVCCCGHRYLYPAI
jgi:protein-histidine pros-kinase